MQICASGAKPQCAVTLAGAIDGHKLLQLPIVWGPTAQSEEGFHPTEDNGRSIDRATIRRTAEPVPQGRRLLRRLTELTRYA
jgi:hypothetical protein